jgi:serine/threonine protein kinase/tetratricopeptide (TPR) repeat protein
MNEETLFIEALEIRDPAERIAYLDRVCAGDAAVRSRLERLLEQHEKAGHFLERPAASATETYGQTPENGAGSRISRELIGARIGPYKLLEQIGEGGMGTVFKAEQQEPIHRLVALKVIKAGMDSLQVISRFDAERQALAIMDHVNIARVFDGGTTETGRPYFVMELVTGLPITKYCDDNHLTPRERLELFVPVCQAIQHAHQKGIIHRDVKPSNVMIATYDGRPVPKVIDFGVAKAIEPTAVERTRFTQHGSIVGTPEYMSPEQAELNPQGIDTRSDIYSLGVLLYELLTGSTPLSHKHLKNAAYAEILRIIREEEPPKPSTRLSGSGESLASISAQRHTEPSKLTKLVRGELDWIVMKCLEKVPNRRYETANGLAADIQHYLSDEPVLACPPSRSYRFQKFARRNKVALVTSSLVAAALVAGTSVAIWQAVVATRAKQDALDAAAETRIERDKAVTLKARADEGAAIALAVNTFLLDDLLAEAAPEQNARDRRVTVEELLARAAKKIDGRFEQQPVIEAAIRQTIGVTYRKMGDNAAALPHLERALTIRRTILGPEHFDTITTMNSLGVLHWARSDYAQAEPLLAKALEIFRRELGEANPHTLATMNNLALVYKGQGQNAKAEPLFVKVWEIRSRLSGSENIESLTVMNNLATVYDDMKQFEKAESLYRQGLEVGRRELTETHPFTINAMHNLGLFYGEQKRYAEAVPLSVKALELSLRVLGEKHDNTIAALNNVASLYREQGQHAKAEPYYLQLLDIRRRVSGNQHVTTLIAMNRLATTQVALGQFDKAEVLLRESLAIREDRRPDEWETFHTKSMLGQSLLGLKRYPDAEPFLLAGYEGIKLREAKLSKQNRSYLTDALDRVVQLYDAWGKKDKADEWRTKAEAIKKADKK